MKTIAEYTERFRKDYPLRYAIAFGELEGAVNAGDDLAEQLRRLQSAINDVEREHDAA